MKKNYLIAIILITYGLSMMGCGQTFRGAGKDLSRMGKGIKTVFVSEES